jgi:hypothetical protein
MSSWTCAAHHQQGSRTQRQSLVAPLLAAMMQLEGALCDMWWRAQTLRNGWARRPTAWRRMPTGGTCGPHFFARIPSSKQSSDRQMSAHDLSFPVFIDLGASNSVMRHKHAWFVKAATTCHVLPATGCAAASDSGTTLRSAGHAADGRGSGL